MNDLVSKQDAINAMKKIDIVFRELGMDCAMDDLISRQAAIDAICEDGTQLERQGQYSMTMAERKQRDADILDALSSAQSKRPKGKWTATYSDCGAAVWVVWKCSECGYVRKKGWEYTNDGKKPDALFCEMCNADMRGEQDE